MHEPVLYQEMMDALRPQADGVYVDGTLGAGGHARGILQASDPSGRLFGFDLDPQALELSHKTLAPFGDRTTLIQASYTQMCEVLAEYDITQVNGIMLDLGVSSMQLDTPERGFSFREDAPLDMRFGPSLRQTAADLVNMLSQEDLADVIYEYGEERFSRRIARAIVLARPLHTTRELAQTVESAVPRSKRSRIHPATRTFQAIRIAVNRELDRVAEVLPIATSLLVPGGRLAVISFHSLEDRLIKRFFRQESQDCVCPTEQPVCTCEHVARLKRTTRKPITASDEEIKRNPRARSAKLRVAEKC